MKEVKNNKKPFIFYYTIVIVVMILLNMFVFPRMLAPAVKEVGYDTFLTMLDKEEIKQVQVEDNQIIFSVKIPLRRLRRQFPEPRPPSLPSGSGSQIPPRSCQIP